LASLERWSSAAARVVAALRGNLATHIAREGECPICRARAGEGHQPWCAGHELVLADAEAERADAEAAAEDGGAPGESWDDDDELPF
jgi:hypothetical protein